MRERRRYATRVLARYVRERAVMPLEAAIRQMTWLPAQKLGLGDRGRLAVGWEYGLDHDYFTQYWSAAFRLNVFGLDPNTPNFTVRTG